MSIIATVIGGVVLLLRKVLAKRLSPKWNYRIWMVFVLALMIPVSIPSKISIYNYVDISDVKFEKKENTVLMLNYYYEDSELIDKVNDEKITNNKILLGKYLRRIIADIWFLWIIIRISGIIDSHKELLMDIGNDEVEDERIVRILERCKKKLKIKRNIRLMRQFSQEGPCTIGVLDIKILLTDEILELDDIALTDIFMHELSHYKRKDHIMLVIIRIIKAVHWFNPFLDKLFDKMRIDLECATDELAISHLSEEEKNAYCGVIVKAAGIISSNIDFVLGLSDNVKNLLERINRISLKEKFEKYSTLISLSTMSIILLMCLLFYPTSYALLGSPRLELKLDNGNVIELTEDEENKKIIRVNQNDEIKLIPKGGKIKDCIILNRIDLENLDNKYIESLPWNKVICFDAGEYIYQFTVTYKNNESIDYVVKIIVE